MLSLFIRIYFLLFVRRLLLLEAAGLQFWIAFRKQELVFAILSLALYYFEILWGRL